MGPVMVTLLPLLLPLLLLPPLLLLARLKWSLMSMVIHVVREEMGGEGKGGEGRFGSSRSAVGLRL